VLAVVAAAAFSLTYSGRSEASDPITRMREDRDVQGLVDVLHNGNDDSAARAVIALGAIRTPQVVAPLIEAVKDTRPPIRERAVLSLVKVTRREHAEQLAGVLKNDNDPNVRAAAAEALGQVYACEQMPDLLSAMEDQAPVVQMQARRSVARICGAEPGFETTNKAQEHKKATAYYKAYWAFYGKLMTNYHYYYNKR